MYGVQETNIIVGRGVVDLLFGGLCDKNCGPHRQIKIFIFWG